MGGHCRPFSIAATTTKRDVDNRFSLKFYYRTADNLLKQANIYREENNIIELYILLLRFSSLVGETIPEHQSYSLAKEKAEYLKKLGQVLTELESLKPEVQKRLDQINKTLPDSSASQDLSSSDYEWPSVKKGSSFQSIGNGKALNSFGGPVSNGIPQWSFDQRGQMVTSLYSSNQLENQLKNLSLSLPVPKEETLSRHSFLGRSGLHGEWRIPTTQAKVQYPSYIDSSPIEIPSLEESWNKGLLSSEDSGPLVALDSEAVVPNPRQESDDRSLQEIRTDIPNATAIGLQSTLVKELSPPPTAVPTENLPLVSESMVQVPPWNVADPRPGDAPSLKDDLSQSKGPKHLHISTQMMEDFLKLAKLNTSQNLETCGVLAGSLKKGIFYVTTLIIPKQQATSDSCQTINEEEIFACQDKRGLFQLGWIHTHPTQTCFMSSVDLHTHYSYQVMLPEAVAIVMAPTDTSRKYGIFRLSDPGGIKVIQQCEMRGFHPHEEPLDGGPIYEHCGHVFVNPKLRFHVIDLR